MDNLRVLGGKLYSQLPYCLVCGNTVFEARVYLLFSCFHMVCQTCSVSNDVNDCSLCPNAQILSINYKVLNRVCEELRAAMRRLLNGDAAGFPEAFTCFYNLVATTTHPAFEPEKPAAPAARGREPEAKEQTFICKCGFGGNQRKTQTLCMRCGSRLA